MMARDFSHEMQKPNSLALRFMFAALGGYITLVNALASSQPFFVLLYAAILSVWFPRILSEEIGRRAFVHKFAAIALMFAGVLLVT